MRIVSLVPSWTETLYDLGAGNLVTGVTRYCVRPEAAHRASIVGGTKDVDLSAVEKINPDLVVLCREENRREDALYLMSRFTCFVVDPKGPEDVVRSIADLSERIGHKKEGTKLKGTIENTLRRTRDILKGSYLCLIWREPYMAVGGDRYSSGLLAHLGLQNLLADREGYPVLTRGEIESLDADLFLLPDEPFPWGPATHGDEFPAFSDRMRFFPGDLVTWHGSRILKALDRLPQLLKITGQA